MILVDADMRQPTLSRRFGIPPGRGVSDLLVDADTVVGPDGMVAQDHLVEHLADVGLAHLRILPAGTVPPNPTELLASAQMRMLHERLRSVADLVIYDSPPLLPVADTLELSSYVDAVLLVVRTEACGRRELGDAIERLDAVGAPSAGSSSTTSPASRASTGTATGTAGATGRARRSRPRTPAAQGPQGRRSPRPTAPPAEEVDGRAPVNGTRPDGAPAAGPASPTPASEPPATTPQPRVAEHEVDPVDPAPAPTWVSRPDRR